MAAFIQTLDHWRHQWHGLYSKRRLLQMRDTWNQLIPPFPVSSEGPELGWWARHILSDYVAEINAIWVDFIEFKLKGALSDDVVRFIIRRSLVIYEYTLTKKLQALSLLTTKDPTCLMLQVL